MGKPKCLTELAVRKQRDAHVERTCKPFPMFATRLEQDADALMTLPGSPDKGPGGEVVRTHSAPDQFAGAVRSENQMARMSIRDTLAQGADRVAEDASVRRTDLLLQPSFNVVALAVDAAESIDAGNSLEKMLAHQMAVAHEMALRFADRALSYEHGKAGDQIEACRVANTVARLMGTFQDAALTLQKLRTGGTQTVTVQHVNVASGGQAAVVGTMQHGEPIYAGGKCK